MRIEGRQIGVTKGQLFSEYFLNEGIRSTEDYQSLPSDQVAETYNQIRELYHTFHGRGTPDEADTEDELVRPTLERLGFLFLRQKSPSASGRQDIPDFLLFTTQEDKDAFRTARRDRKPWNRGICILEGKKWNRALDRGDKMDPIDPRIPSNQILRYMSTVEVASSGKILWGVLTNGRLWRLYYHRFPTRSQGYLEADLGAVFDEASDLFASKRSEEERVELFRLFYLFFRREAFIQADWRPHATFLELALDEGKKWEERVAEDLRNNIFGEVFPLLAQGFLRAASERCVRIDDGLLDTAYKNALVLLYRLLFVFHAEDRNLLPLSDPRYEDYSLSRIRDELVERLESGAGLSETAKTYWDRLRSLFTIVNSGDNSLGVSPYNGGLFEPRSHPFLEDFWVADSFLVPALDMVSRDYGTSPPKRINYRDLSVRQLGSIYEGLLEFRLKLADSDLTVKKQKRKEVYEPTDDQSRAVVKKGEVYLTNERSERKATGSYYTPDYIVQCVVRKTLGPLLDKMSHEFETRIAETKAAGKRAILEKLHGCKRFDPKIYDEHKRVIGEKTLGALRTEFLQTKDPAEQALGLKILDPAMGSGHFLVGAVDYLADRVLEMLAEYSDRSYFGTEMYRSPIVLKLEKIRSRIAVRAREGKYYVDESKLDDKNLIRRIILKRCMYGVDTNPLAVELAKVSLWLHTFTVGAPLSFLDHHLKFGNSLVGGDPEGFEQTMQRALFGSRYAGIMDAVTMQRAICELTDIDVSEVDKSIEISESVSAGLTPHKELLDILTGELFLNPRQAKKHETRYAENIHLPLWHLLATYGDPLGILQKKTKRTTLGEVPLTEKEQRLVEEYVQFARHRRFFHWKLEFPEVWYEPGREKSDMGFDVIIGNPPYIRIQTLRKREPADVEYFNCFYSSPVGSYDIYVLFVERGMELLAESGTLGYILPNKFVKLDFGRNLRGATSSHVREFIDFGSNQVFPGETTYTGLLFVDREKRTEISYAKAPLLKTQSGELAHWLENDPDALIKIPTSELGAEPWIFLPKRLRQVKNSLERISEPLGSLVENIIVGLQTSADRVYILELKERTGDTVRAFSKASASEVVLEADLLRPLVSGEDISRYQFPWTNKLLLFPYKLLPENRVLLVPPHELEELYPRTWEYLKNHEDELRDREDGRFADDQWYRFGRKQNLGKHERSKLAVARLCEDLGFIYDVEGRYYLDNVDVNGVLLKEDSPYSGWYLLALLNSKLIDWRFKSGTVPFRGDYFSANKQFVAPLPIRTINFGKQDKRTLAGLKSLSSRASTANLVKEIRALPSDSAVLHDLLSFLAEEITNVRKEGRLLQLFRKDELREGSPERIQVLQLLSGMDKELPQNVTVQKEMARHLAERSYGRAAAIDEAINSIVFHLYELSIDDITAIEGAVCRAKPDNRE